MEFQFQTDITGLPIAKCDLECEAFGDWLSHDLSTDKSNITLLLQTTEKLLSKQLSHYQFTGKVYHLIFENDEVELVLNNNEVSTAEFADEHDNEHVTGCGLVDFKHLLEEWANFVRRPYLS
ncbi:YacL family protein [Paraglaciecola aquimarina]|uniref:YacL family protein n=1 Tax=Paraglaciecola aquimarina TaxID=1235557 RepID=A0ABU3SVU6_9ALTE|nr:YacL family protein [Paraglaciecola aquimarina]MDU0354107.1 YacL family protein [Paraglaciecola aquimarina]